MEILFLLFEVLFVVGLPIALYIVYLSYKKKSQEQQKQLNKQVIQDKITAAQEYLNKIHAEQKIPVINTGLLLKKAEVAYLQDNNIELYETRVVRKSATGGGAIRVAKGVYIGGSKGSSRGVDELTKIDKGSLVLTNQRIIFGGSLNTKDIKLANLMNIKEYTDGIELSIEDKAKNQTYIGLENPFLWKALIYYVRNLPETGEFPQITLEIE